MQEHWFQPLGTSSSWNFKHTVPRLGSMDSNDQWFQDLEASVQCLGTASSWNWEPVRKWLLTRGDRSFSTHLRPGGGAKASRAGVGW